MWRTLIVLSLPPAFAAGSGRGLWAKVSASCVEFWDQLRKAELHIDALSIEDGIGISASSYRHIHKFLTTVPFDDAVFCVEAAISAATSSDAVLMSHVAESIAKLPNCFREMTFKSEAETRCAQRWYKVAIHVLKVNGLQDAAESMWRRAKSIKGKDGKALIGWPSPSQSPTVWVSGLSTRPYWNCSSWPFIQGLEAAAPVILKEIERKDSEFLTAYPYLQTAGVWEDLFLYRGHQWNTTLCQSMPSTCRLLLPELPTRPGVPYATVYNEEVVIFRSKRGASVGAHCGSSNGVINLHLTLKGGRGTSVSVDGLQVDLRDGEAICFQDSYFHSVHHGLDGEEERISLVVRVMHPDMDAKLLGSRTDSVPDLQAWDRSASLLKEVERLREEYRKLAAAVGGQDSSCSV
ncbi:unnamed protein product [Symbiodinium sp. CCMP2592]|nr:unnamed protein product [Symbiodinium sp. CCMP2592]